MEGWGGLAYSRGMSRAATTLLLLVAILLGACGSDGPPASTKGRYTLDLFGYTAFAGRRMQLKLKSADGSVTLASYQGSIRPDGTRTIVFEEVLEEDVVYRVDHFIDLDNNDAYTPPSGTDFSDPSWRRMVTGRVDGVYDLHTADNDWTDISPF